MSPMGRPSAEKPHGIEAAGMPKLLKGEQLDPTDGSVGSPAFSSRSSASLMVGCITRHVGSTTRSWSTKASSMVFRIRCSSHWALM